MTGILIIDKPLHLSSMDVIRKLRRITGIKKIGHAGTLDPLATGVLVVCIGREATKHIDKLMATEKEYIATVDLSAFTSTDDLEGERSEVDVLAPPTPESIDAAINQFIGTIQQVPPTHSAIHIAGQRAYKLAREGKSIEMPPRTVTIQAIEVLEYEWPTLKIKVTCGAGTYIRSLARDIGTALNTGGHLTGLVRTRSGQFIQESAYQLADLTTIESSMLLDPNIAIAHSEA